MQWLNVQTKKMYNYPWGDKWSSSTRLVDQTFIRYGSILPCEDHQLVIVFKTTQLKGKSHMTLFENEIK